MSVRKALAPLTFLVFPLALLFVYWENAYFDGHPLDRTIHLTTFLGLAVLLVLEALFRYEKAVSQKKLVVRDIAATAVNVFVTITVGSALFVPIVLFVSQALFGRSLFFATSD